MVINRICSKCKIEKSISNFSLKKGKIRNICKECSNLYQKQRNAKFKEINCNIDPYVDINKTKKCWSCKKEMLVSNFHKHSSRIDGLSDICKDCNAIINKEKLKDPKTKIIHNLRNRLNKILKSRKSHIIYLIGCSPQELKLHIENSFYANKTTGEQMSWENYGRWHIDHIRPLSSFDFTDENNIKLANHYTNLQPLWAEENLKKSNRR